MNKKESDKEFLYYFEVAIPTPIHATFTYSYHEQIQPGSRVSLTFGKQKLIGVILRQIERPIVDYEIKKITSLIDDSSPILSKSLINIATWISSYYFAPIGEVIKTMIPIGLNVKKDNSYILSFESLSIVEQNETYRSVLLPLFYKRIKPKKRKKKQEDNNPVNSSTSASSDLFQDCTYKFLSEKAITKQTLLKNIPSKLFDELIRKKILIPRQYIQEAKLKHNFSSTDISLSSKPLPNYKDPGFKLSDQQQQAIDTVLSSQEAQTFLLFGVTGSGKTEVFLQLIKHFLIDPEFSTEPFPSQVLILVPEISLTPQMTSVFESRFGSTVSVVHSGMSDTKRWQALENIRTGQTRILIGARSSIFANFQNLKLIIVDEEHDSSYKQTTGVTYNARDIAVLRGKQEAIPTLLSSATPSLESYYNALTGKYKLITMPDRIPGATLPDVKLVQKKISFSSGSLFTKANTIKQSEGKEEYIDPVIMEALEENYAAGNQSIILVNRRGYAFYLMSATSKSPVTCPNCSISLTLHKNSESLKCHYCDFSIKLKDFTKMYPNDKFIIIGYGSEKIEQELKTKLTDCTIERLDSDTTKTKGSLEGILERFRNETTDILVGTQMLAKGHDFPKVSVVVLLEVDQIMNMPDFRAGEKTFQLLVQASGRAGRSSTPGTVYLQTFRVSHPIIKKALAHDYSSFAKEELQFRKSFGYPPYSRMIQVELLSENHSVLLEFCSKISNLLQVILNSNPHLKEGSKVVGPITPGLERINTLYRKTILFTSKDPLIRKVVQKLYEFYMNQTSYKNKIKFRVDVDPQSLF